MKLLPVTAAPPRQTAPPPDPRGIEGAGVRAAAEAFEAIFVAQMLRHAGVGRMADGFNGGPGEAEFADMLTHEYARAIARTGRLGIAEVVMTTLRETK